MNLKTWNLLEDKLDRKIYYGLSGKELLPSSYYNRLRGANWHIQEFFMHIKYVVDHFLEDEDESARELFIQIPVEELAVASDRGNTDVKRDRFRWLNGTLMASLCQACSGTSFRPKDFDQNYDQIVWDKHINEVYVARSNEEKYYFVITELNSGKIGPRFYKIPKSKNSKHLTKSRALFDNLEKNSIIKLNSNVTKVSDKDFETIRSCTDAFFSMHGLKINYGSAVLLIQKSYSPVNDNIPLGNNKNILPIRCENDPKKLNSPDVIIACGDKTYMNCSNRLRNCNPRKLIFIGTEKPFSAIMTYPFTFREMYRYCDGEALKEPHQIKLDFPWLDSRKKELEKLLQSLAKNDEYLTDKRRSEILRFMLMPFLSLGFSTEELVNIKERYSNDYITEKTDFEASEETIEALSNWEQCLTFNEINPKENWLKQQQHVDLVLNRIGSGFYKQRVKRLNGKNNVIVMDAPAHTSYDHRYSFVRRYCMYAEIDALYYQSYEDFYQKTLLRYINRENDVYNSEIRKRFGTNIEITSTSESPEIPQSLLDFAIDEYEYYNAYNGSKRGYNIEVTFEDKSKAVIDGDVLINEGDEYVEKNISDLEGDENAKGLEITYYEKSDSFDEYTRCYYDFPENGDVKTYSDLWKRAFISLYKELTFRSDAVKTIHKATGLKERTIKQYSKPYAPYFLKSQKDMNRIVEYLIDNKKITSDEGKYVLASHNVYKKNTRLGLQLKTEIYSYLMRADQQLKVLNRISTNSEGKISVEDIVKSSLKRGIIKSIKSV